MKLPATTVPLLAALLLPATHFATARPRYTVTDLGDNSPNAINNAGQVVGSTNLPIYDAPGAPSHAFLYEKGTLTDLGALPGDTDSGAADINENGVIIGSSSAGGVSHSFIYQNGAMTQVSIPVPAPYTDFTISGINNAGRIVGTFSSDYPSTPFLSIDGVAKDLGAFSHDLKYSSPAGFAAAINTRGQVVGAAAIRLKNKREGLRAFLYSGGKLKDLGALGGTNSYAYAINDRGQIVGIADTARNTQNREPYVHAFLYDNGRMLDLGTLGGLSSTASDINSHGIVVGAGGLKKYDLRGKTGTHAFLSNNGGPLTDLNTLLPPGWSLDNASAINDIGQILATGRNPAKQFHYYILTPVPSLTVAGGKRLSTRNGSLVVRGTANDIVDQVTFRVGSRGAFRKAQGPATRWHFNAGLMHGKNHIAIRARSRAGETSSTRITVTRN